MNLTNSAHHSTVRKFTVRDVCLQPGAQRRAFAVSGGRYVTLAIQSFWRSACPIRTTRRQSGRRSGLNASSATISNALHVALRPSSPITSSAAARAGRIVWRTCGRCAQRATTGSRKTPAETGATEAPVASLALTGGRLRTDRRTHTGRALPGGGAIRGGWGFNSPACIGTSNRSGSFIRAAAEFEPGVISRARSADSSWRRNFRGVQ